MAGGKGMMRVWRSRVQGNGRAQRVGAGVEEQGSGEWQGSIERCGDGCSRKEPALFAMGNDGARGNHQGGSAVGTAGVRGKRRDCSAVGSVGARGKHRGCSAVSARGGAR